MNKKTAKTKRLICQSKTITFEKIHDMTQLKKAQEKLLSNDYVIHSHMEYSTRMKSNLVHHLNIERANEILKSIIPVQTKKRTQDFLSIDYYIYENDKKDKGKKNKNALKYAGYLMFEFKLDKQLIYKIQTDYMQIDGQDIKERMQCVIDSFLTLKEN